MNVMNCSVAEFVPLNNKCTIRLNKQWKLQIRVEWWDLIALLRACHTSTPDSCPINGLCPSSGLAPKESNCEKSQTNNCKDGVCLSQCCQ